jgi:hypothetical protein
MEALLSHNHQIVGLFFSIFVIGPIASEGRRHRTSGEPQSCSNPEHNLNTMMVRVNFSPIPFTCRGLEKAFACLFSKEKIMDPIGASLTHGRVVWVENSL